MFRRLRLQFITIASLAILFILVFTVGIINTVRSFQTEQEISKVLNTLTENNGSFGKTKKIKEKNITILKDSDVDEIINLLNNDTNSKVAI